LAAAVPPANYRNTLAEFNIRVYSAEPSARAQFQGIEEITKHKIPKNAKEITQNSTISDINLTFNLKPARSPSKPLTSSLQTDTRHRFKVNHLAQFRHNVGYQPQLPTPTNRRVHGNARHSIPVAVHFAKTDNHEPTVGVDEETYQRYLEAQLNALHGNTPLNPRTLPKPRIWRRGARSLGGGAWRSVLFGTTPIAIDPQNISEVNYRKALASNIQHVPEPIERKHLHYFAKTRTSREPETFPNPPKGKHLCFFAKTLLNSKRPSIRKDGKHSIGTCSPTR
jgi:hypothetical protein